MVLPEQLLLSDLLRRRVRCDRGLDHGPGCAGWMHPPVHRLLGWVSRPSSFGTRRCVWRLDQLRGLTEQEVLVQGDPAESDAATIERLPTLLEASLLDRRQQPLGRLVDVLVDLRSGRILDYLVARSDPRLPGSSRWRLNPDRLLDQRSGQVFTALEGLEDLPLARASVRQELQRRSRRWRDQVEQETSRLRERFQQAGDRFEDRLEGWLEEPPWSDGDELDGVPPGTRDQRSGPDPWEFWEEEEPQPAARRRPPAEGPSRRYGPERRRFDDQEEEDPWV